MTVSASTQAPLRKVLVIFAHPSFESSRVNRALLGAVSSLPNVTVHDLYETYPEQLIDADTEQALVAQHDVIVFQHPLYWYSCPPLMKNWIDTVLTRGWAYGEGGNALEHKSWVNAISSGGAASLYQRGAQNNFSPAEFLRPFEQTARLCGMYFLRPFLTDASINLDDDTLDSKVVSYRAWLQGFINGDALQKVHSLHAAQADFIENGDAA
ncbi:MAG: NAD(P)H-dependent oxidoreductase [Candidatus Methylopumilus sp.]|jgi:glutathione-regulated potassium-efflux system ancillary protein KefG